MTLTQGYILHQRYQIQSPLGRGGFGAVYYALDRNLNRVCAVKENLDASPAVQEQFHREAQVLAQLRHPNLPQVTDYFVEPDGRQYLVMEYIAGDDLNALVLRRGPLSEPQALNWLTQVLDALEYLHGQIPPIVHRDIKPANIRLSPSAPNSGLPYGRAVLVDFGISKAYVAGQMTTLGARAVTEGYSPPEQYGSGTDPRSDLYALGATLYFVATGRVPLASPLRLGSPERFIAPRQLNAALSTRLEGVILRSMELAADARFSSASEFKRALSQPQVGAVVSQVMQSAKTTVVAHPPPRAVPESRTAEPHAIPLPPEQIRARPARFIPMLLGAVVVLCLAFGAGTVMYLGGASTRATPFQPATLAPAGISSPPRRTDSAPVSTLYVPSPAGGPDSSRSPASSSTRALQTATLSPVPQPVVLFTEDFGGTALDPATWIVENNPGGVSVGGGYLRMASSSTRYPYVHTRKNPFPVSGNFSLRYSFRYARVDVCGVGVLMSSYAPSAGITQDEANAVQQTAEQQGVSAGIWQDIKQGLHITFRSAGDHVDVPFPGPDTNLHRLAITFTQSKYQLYLDERLVYESRLTPYRPRNIWMGNMVDLGAGYDCPWDTLEVGPIRVQTLP